MKRRQLIRYGGIGMATAIASSLMPRPERAMSSSGRGTSSMRSSVSARSSFAIAQATDGVAVQYLGHTCFLFTGNGLKVLVNPYQAVGCTAGYILPDLQPDVILVSSFMLDEGAVDAVPGNPKVISQRGMQKFGGIEFQGFSLPHDRQGGKRFGQNIAWRWTQGGVNILHLGGAAGELATEDKILLGGADILLAPVGGGMKAYNSQEARKIVKILNPRMIIPTHYRTAAANKENCDLAPVDEFLALAADLEVDRVGSDRFTVKKSYLKDGETLVRVLDYTS